MTIRDDLYREVKEAAARAGEPVGSVVEHALVAFLAHTPDDRPPSPLPVFADFAPKAGVDFTRSSELLHDLDALTDDGR